MRLRELYLAGGCFWGLEKYLSLLPGVEGTEVGYANGSTARPTYEQVCYLNTGHAETVKVVYDPARLPLERLLEAYFEAIDPVSKNRQGNDSGTQYRTGIYWTDPADEQPVRRALWALQQNHRRPLAVEALPLQSYWPAEEYHQQYLEKNPEGYCHLDAACFERARRWGEKP